MASLRRRLQRQLEFYLSASNLRQDKFLQQHMDDDGFVPVALFLSFHKVQTLRATEKLVLEAAAKSDALRVDEARVAIAPTREALEEAREGGRSAADDHTIYVEGYDVAAHDHDSLRKLFAPFGKVSLVSMPRFLPSRKFKGFAFVEFATEDAALKVLEATQGANRDESLRGLRTMSKRQWTNMKDKLKAQLGASLEPKTKPAECKAPTEVELTIPSLKTSSGHVRFRDEDDDEEQEEEEQETKRPRPNDD